MNKLLQRQLQKHYADGPIPENLTRLLQVISESYDHHEKDRRMIERSIELSSKEMIELNNRIKKEKEELKKAHNDVRQIIDLVPHFIFAKNVNGKFILANEAVACAYGSTVEGLIGKSDADFNPNKEEVAHFMQEDLEVINSGKARYNLEETVTDAAGNIRILSTTKIPYTAPADGSPGVLGVSIDISEHKRAEMILSESASQLAIAARIAKLGYWEFDVIKGLFTFNDQFYHIFKTTAENVGGYTMTPHRYAELFVYPEDREIVGKEVAAAINSDDPYFDHELEHRIIYADGKTGYISVHFYVVKDEQGRTIKTFGVNQDITERKNAEQLIRNSEETRKLIMNAALDAIICMDIHGAITVWTPQAEKIFGWTEAEILGKDMADTIIPRQYRERHKQGLRRYLQSGIGVVINKVNELTALSREGREFPIELSILPIKQGDTQFFCAFIRDITDRKNGEAEVRRSEERYRQIVETAQEGIWMIDENDQTTFINRRMCEMLGYSAGEIMSKEVFCFMDEEGKQVARQNIEKRKAGGSGTLPFKFITKTGDALWTSVSNTTVLNDGGKYMGALAMITDMTQQKLDEELLFQSEINLAVKNKELEQKNKELEQFAYVASHDMQEPLRTTTSFVELLQQQYAGKLDDKADRYLRFIWQSSERMKVLIKDLLDYSRIGRKKELTAVDCNAVLAEVLADLGAAINETGAEIKTEHLPVVSGYHTEIKQLFQNLMINAIKFRKKNMVPKIKISAQLTASHWQFALDDNGIGIPKEHNERIFIIFQRLHNRNEYDGSGIGLSHCKKIVDLHKGNIWVDSIPGEGSTFYFTISHHN